MGYCPCPIVPHCDNNVRVFKVFVGNTNICYAWSAGAGTGRLYLDVVEHYYRRRHWRNICRPVMFIVWQILGLTSGSRIITCRLLMKSESHFIGQPSDLSARPSERSPQLSLHWIKWLCSFLQLRGFG